MRQDPAEVVIHCVFRKIRIAGSIVRLEVGADVPAQRFQKNLKALRGGIVDLKPITREILLQTADLRSIINYKLPDAIHIVTATEAGCAYFGSYKDDL